MDLAEKKKLVVGCCWLCFRDPRSPPEAALFIVSVVGSDPEHPAVGTEGRDGVLGAGSAGAATMEESPQGSSMVACEEEEEEEAEGGLSLHRNLATPVMEESDAPLPFSLESKRGHPGMLAGGVGMAGPGGSGVVVFLLVASSDWDAPRLVTGRPS